MGRHANGGRGMRNLGATARLAFLIAGAVLFVGCAATNDFIIVPGERVGPVTGATTEAELRALFGERQVRLEVIEIGEGFTRPGLVIHPNDPSRRLEILTAESGGGRIEEIRIRGGETMWRTERGITLGTTLSEIEALNGGPVTLTGFGWDYGGTILDRRGGGLRELGGMEGGSVAGRTLLLRVEPAPGAREKPEYGEALGDRDFGSDHPAIRALEPRVYEMTVIFPGP